MTTIVKKRIPFDTPQDARAREKGFASHRDKENHRGQVTYHQHLCKIYDLDFDWFHALPKKERLRVIREKKGIFPKPVIVKPKVVRVKVEQQKRPKVKRVVVNRYLTQVAASYGYTLEDYKALTITEKKRLQSAARKERNHESTDRKTGQSVRVVRLPVTFS